MHSQEKALRLTTRKRKRSSINDVEFTDNDDDDDDDDDDGYNATVQKSKKKFFPPTIKGRTTVDKTDIRNTRSSNDEDFHLRLERKSSKNNNLKMLDFPNHMLVFGSTQAGKTRLIAEILDNIETVYNLDSTDIEHRKLVIVSPIARLEITDHMSTKHLWEIELYNVSELKFDEQFENHLKKEVFLTHPKTVNILLLDDVLTATASKPNDMNSLDKWFSYFRHINVSIIGTIHSYNLKFSTIIDQAGLIVSMYCINTSSVLRDILKRHLYRGTAKVWSEIRRLFLANLRLHDYVCLNFTKEALSSQRFFITNSLFDPAYGVNMRQIYKEL